MPRQTDPNSNPKKPAFPRILATLLGIPILLVIGAGALYSFNDRLSGLDIPTHTMPPDNAYDDFAKAGQMAKNMQHKSPYSMPGPPAQVFTLANFAAAAQDAEPALLLLRQGLNKPYQYPPDRSNQDNNFPVFSKVRELARTVAGVSTYEELSGHPDRAMETRLDGLEMGVMIPHGGGILPQLVGTACEAIAERNAERLLPQLSPQELAHAADRLDKIAAKRTPFADIELEEGYSTTARNLEMLKDHSDKGLNSFQALHNYLTMDEKASLTWQQRWQVFSFLYSDKTSMLRANLDCYKARAEEARKPYTGKSALPIPGNLLAEMEIPIADTAREQALRPETLAVILQTEVALYRFKAGHGKFPGTLAELTPTCLKALPDDPFGGKAGAPLRYQVQEEGRSYLLYSLGPDLKDDGGVAQPKPYDPGDIVAGKLWPATLNRY